jgi:cyanophycin synthetase
VGGGVCEVNVIPGFRPHLVAGTPPATIADAILGLRIPDGTDGRVPTVAVTGSSGKTTVCRLVTRILEARGLATGLACSDGIYVGGHRVRAGDFAGGMGPPALRLNARVQAAVYETARGGLARHGVPFDACDVAALLNVSADHVGFDGVASIEEMVHLKSLILPLARRGVVLNADDARCRDAGRRFAAPRTAWFSLAPPDGFLSAAIEAGARAAWLDGDVLVVSDAAQRTPVGTLAQFPLAHGGSARHNVANLLAAAAIGTMLGIPVEAVAQALRATTPADTAGRLTVLEIGDSTLVLDRADSAADLRALSEFVARIASGRPRTLVFSCPGNRNDEQARAMAREAAGGFEHYVVYSWRELRGRTPEAIPALLGAALAENGTPGSAITVEPDQARALDLAARRFGPGQVCVVVCPDLHDARDVEAFRARFAAAPRVSAPSART